MKKQSIIRERYLRDGLKIRLGGIAANLARIESFSRHPDHEEVVEHLIEESALFIEWTARDVQDEVILSLVELQCLLVRKRRSRKEIWSDRKKRDGVAKSAREWSQKILMMAGYISSN